MTFGPCMKDIRRIKAATDMAMLASAYTDLGGKLPVLKGRCPFWGCRSEAETFEVHTERRRYRCHKCGHHGDAISFVQQVQGVEFYEAAYSLGLRAGLNLPADWIQRLHEEGRRYHEKHRAEDEAFDKRMEEAMAIAERRRKEGTLPPITLEDCERYFHPHCNVRP